ncbi:MAG: hypothetical protein LBE01_01525, partial [Deltaproteobacteria bacterium]|nr:hypothetical protein [Deltaproteobacteria bacterium]
MNWLKSLGKLIPHKGHRSGQPFNVVKKLNDPASFGLKVSFVVAVALTTVLLSNPAPERYLVGEVANRTIRADREIAVPDPLATAAARLEAFRETPPILTLDERATDASIGKIRQLFRQGRELMVYFGYLPERFKQEFEAFFSGPDSGELLAEAMGAGFSESLERAAAWLTLELLTQGVLADDLDHDLYAGRNVEIDRLGLGVSNLVPYDSLLTRPKAQFLVGSRARLMDLEANSTHGRLAGRLALASLAPNLALDHEKLELKRFQAVAAVKEIRHYVAPGELLAREGEKITPLISLKLNALREAASPRRWLMSSLGLFVVMVLFLAVSQVVAFFDKKYVFAARDLILVAFLILMNLVMAWSSNRLGQNLSRGFDHIEIHTVFMAMPFATISIIGATFLGLRRTLFVTFLGAVPAAAVAPMDSLIAFVYVCNGAMIAIWRLNRMSERARLIPAAGLVALVNCLTVFGASLLSGQAVFSSQLLFDLDAALLSGLLSGIVASGLIPFFEMTLGFTTNLKLLELGNLNRPILRELMLAAPGTYHHSVIVGSMVEAAAEAIGANS